MEGGDNEILGSIVNLISGFGGLCSGYKIVYVKSFASLVWVLGLVVWNLWRGGFKILWVQNSLVAMGKTFCGRGSIPPREICFIVIDRQT